MNPVELWPGQKPGVHDHKPYDECPLDCPGRLHRETPFVTRDPRNTRATTFSDGKVVTEYTEYQVVSTGPQVVAPATYHLGTILESAQKFADMLRAMGDDPRIQKRTVRHEQTAWVDV